MSGDNLMGFSRVVGPLTGDFLRASMAAAQQRQMAAAKTPPPPPTLPPCAFVLNDKPMSTFTLNGTGYDAFSGLNEKVNKRASVCEASEGAIPLGTYYIVDRQSGGRLGWIRDAISGKDEWFALYAKDEAVDDVAFCNKVRRGEFRLHPKVGMGISKGCITIDKVSDFDAIRKVLLGARKWEIPELKGTLAYAIVVVT